MHAGAVGVEEARDLDAQFVLAVIVKEQGLGAALALIVAGVRADRFSMAPVVFPLGGASAGRRTPRWLRPGSSCILNRCICVPGAISLARPVLFCVKHPPATPGALL
jgi:hypothetical protein